MGIWFCFPLGRSPLHLLPPWGAVPPPLVAPLISSPTSTDLRLAWLGLISASPEVEYYCIAYPTSRLGSSARWQRYAIALSFAPRSGNWTDSSARVDLVCRWSPFSPHSLSIAACEKVPFLNKISDEMTAPLSESSYATRFHPRNSLASCPWCGQVDDTYSHQVLLPNC